MEEKLQILVVDDEKMIRESVSSYLSQKGYITITAESGKEALDAFYKHPISFIILDLMLPDVSGEEVCMEIRKTSRVPVIMLTAKTMEEDLLKGLAIGADDYMTKPFSLKELAARIEVVLRRTSCEGALSSVFAWNREDLVVDLGSRSITKTGTRIELTPIEWNILEALMKRPNKVFSREELIEIAFDEDFDGYDRVIDTHVKNLRKKIETDSKKPCYILTVHGIGYRFGGEK